MYIISQYDDLIKIAIEMIYYMRNTLNSLLLHDIIPEGAFTEWITGGDVSSGGWLCGFEVSRFIRLMHSLHIERCALLFIRLKKISPAALKVPKAGGSGPDRPIWPRGQHQ